MMDLSEYRTKIDEIDRQLVALFTERMATAADIAAYKKAHHLPVLDAAREQQKLRQIAELAPAALQNETQTLYRLLLALSRSYQSRLLGPVSPLPAEIEKAISDTPQLFPTRAAIACQDVEGAYSQLACERLFRTAEISCFPDLDAVFAAVDEGLCRYAVVPLESSAVCDLMMRCNFRIVRSVRLKPDRCPTSAVGEGSSESSQDGNSMRFLCISKQLEIYPGADRTSLMMTLPREPGALADVLSCLSALGISLGRLESRAACTFYFELEAPVSSPQFLQCMGELGKISEGCSYLGSYSEVV
mgnify:FL=1